MAKVKVTFTSPQKLGAASVNEVMVEADRLMAVRDGEVVLDVEAESVAGVSRLGGTSARIAAARAKHRRAYRAWTEQEDAALREMWAAGAGVTVLVERLERQPGGVVSRLVKLGIIDAASAQGLSWASEGQSGT